MVTKFKYPTRRVSSRTLTPGEQRLLNYRFEKNYRQMVYEKSGGAFRVFFFVLCVLMFYSVAFNTGRTITFTSLLQSLADAPVIDNSWISSFSDLTIRGDWGIFDFLKNFLNSFVGVISFLLYLVNGLVQLITYFGYIIRTLFFI